MLEPGHPYGRLNAVVQYGAGVTDMRGSIGGTVFSRGAGGAIARKRTMPINPRSPTQGARRARVAELTKRWSKTLTEQMRIDWRAYAAATTWTNRLGQVIQINGLAAYLRLNTLFMMLAGSIRDDAPTAPGHGGGITCTFLAESDTTKLQMAEPTGDWLKTDTPQVVLVSMGHPMEPGRLAPPKGFIHVGFFEGHAGSPPAFPYELDAAYTMRADQTVTIRTMFIDENWRVAGPFLATATAAPGI